MRAGRKLVLLVAHELIKTVNDREGKLSNCLKQISSIIHGRGNFILCLANTKTSDIEGISAAGANAQMRRLTATLDAEALLLGSTLTSNSLPVSPLGIVSPVVITRAALSKLNIETTVIDCGTFYPPQIPHISLNNIVSECVSSGNALPYDLVESLFQSGLAIGKEMAKTHDYLVLAECVPGGTTTAQAVLQALAYDVQNLFSSSLPNGNHKLKAEIIEQGLKKAKRANTNISVNPTLATAALGDAMQATMAGIVLGVEGKIPIALGGGSQMLAVWALTKAMAAFYDLYFYDYCLCILTTKWVAFDPSANCLYLSKLLDASMAATCPNFLLSQYEGLKSYEAGNVKEGVGAGASLALAYMSGISESEMMMSVDKSYEALVK
jgi:uncharacterized protein (TIGR00303 family)